MCIILYVARRLSAQLKSHSNLARLPSGVTRFRQPNLSIYVLAQLVSGFREFNSCKLLHSLQIRAPEGNSSLRHPAGEVRHEWVLHESLSGQDYASVGLGLQIPHHVLSGGALQDLPEDSWRQFGAVPGMSSTFHRVNIVKLYKYEFCSRPTQVILQCVGRSVDKCSFVRVYL